MERLIKKVLIYLDNIPEYLGVLANEFQAGNHIFLVNYREKKEQVEKIVESNQINLIIDKHNFHKFVSKAEFQPENYNNPVSIFTTGTTGLPCLHTFNVSDLYDRAKSFCTYLNLEKMDTIIVIPLSSIGGFNLLLRAKVIGGKISIVKSIEDCELFDNCFLSLFPAQLKTMSQEKLKQLNKARLILIGGESIDSDAKEIIERNQLNCLVTYGMTETAGTIALSRDLGTTYKALSDIKFDIEDQSLKVLIKDQAIKTNDQVDLISDLEIKNIRRDDRWVNSGGFKFRLDDLEQKILSISDVQSVSCVKIKHKKWGESVKCNFRGEITIENLLIKLKASLPNYMIPDLERDAGQDKSIS